MSEYDVSGYPTKPRAARREPPMITGSLTADNVSGSLRFLADAYEQAQRVRIQAGERIRAVLQGRDDTWTADSAKWAEDPDLVLLAIEKGTTLGPVPILGRTYHRHFTEEHEMLKEMQHALKAHPTYPWLSRVKGIGPTLGCKLLARLDPKKAEHCSSFWAYCGLATIPGNLYRCSTCKLERSYPVTFNVTGKHQPLDADEASKKQCPGELVLVAGPEDGVRCAQPKSQIGEKSSYDRYAKKLMYLVGTSFLKAGGKYEQIYRNAYARLTRERPYWRKGRIHATALRKVEKLFLSHLWHVWRTALELPVTTPYPLTLPGHEAEAIDAWEMLDK